MQHEATKQRLIKHFEKYLGPCRGAWSMDSENVRVPFHVVRFDGPPFKGCTAFATIGLSDIPLSGPKKMLKLELFSIIRNEVTGPLPMQEVLQQVGRELVSTRTALLRGDVLGPRSPLWPGSKLEALYVTMPAYFADDFAECELGEGERCAIVWLAPITRDEAQYVRAKGWAEFENALVKENPDLLAVYRDGMHSTGTQG